jgi:hypothetical protein
MPQSQRRKAIPSVTDHASAGIEKPPRLGWFRQAGATSSLGAVAPVSAASSFAPPSAAVHGLDPWQPPPFREPCPLPMHSPASNVLHKTRRTTKPAMLLVRYDKVQRSLAAAPTRDAVGLSNEHPAQSLNTLPCPCRHWARPDKAWLSFTKQRAVAYNSRSACHLGDSSAASIPSLPSHARLPFTRIDLSNT